MDKESLISKHKQYTHEGFVLVSLVENYDGGYWVNESVSRKVLSQLRRFGITQGSISEGKIELQ